MEKLQMNNFHQLWHLYVHSMQCYIVNGAQWIMCVLLITDRMQGCDNNLLESPPRNTKLKKNWQIVRQGFILFVLKPTSLSLSLRIAYNNKNKQKVIAMWIESQQGKMLTARNYLQVFGRFLPIPSFPSYKCWELAFTAHTWRQIHALASVWES